MVTRKLEHTFCDNCGKEIKEKPYSLIREGSEWDTCSSQCHFELEERKHQEMHERLVELQERYGI
jgi:ribosome-binding protein aMBF1 (putative translation factor)